MSVKINLIIKIRRGFFYMKKRAFYQLLLCILCVVSLSVAVKMPQQKVYAEDAVYLSDLPFTEWKMYQSSSDNLS